MPWYLIIILCLFSSITTNAQISGLPPYASRFTLHASLIRRLDNGKSVFKEVMEIALKDIYMPWKWEYYLPYNNKNNPF